MQISKLKLQKNGLKGLEVTYLKVIKKDGVPFKVPHKVKYPYPVVGALSKAIRSLEKEFGIIIGLKPFVEGEEENFDNVAVQAVECSEENFSIEASVEVIPGSFTTFSTPVLNSESGHHRFKDCMEKIDQILSLVTDYVEGDQKLDAHEIVLSFHKNDDDFDMDAFNVLNKKEKHEMMIAELEGAGMVVLRDETHDEKEAA